MGGIQHLQMYGNFEGFGFQSALLGVVILIFHDLCQPTVINDMSNEELSLVDLMIPEAQFLFCYPVSSGV